MKFEIGLSEEQKEQNSQGFILTGFTIQGAEYSQSDERFKMTEKTTTDLPEVNFKWINIEQAKKEANQDMIQIPVYLNTLRANLLTQDRKSVV